MGVPPRAGRPLPSSFIYRGRGHPRTHKFLLQPRAMPPSVVTYLDHTIVELRRSPAPVASSSPSPRRRADRTLPHPQLDQEIEGRHRAECVLNVKVSYVRCLDRSDLSVFRERGSPDLPACGLRRGSKGGPTRPIFINTKLKTIARGQASRGGRQEASSEAASSGRLARRRRDQGRGTS